MSNIIDSILISGTTYTIQGSGGGGGNPTVELLQEQYDALVSAGTVAADTYYIITDADAIDMNNYLETSAFTAYSASVDTTLQGKQPTLTAGSGIEISSSNTISCTGGGKTYTAGRGITISTANTIALNVPIYSGTSSNTLKGNTTNNTAQNQYETSFGNYNNSVKETTAYFGYSGNTLFSVGNGYSSTYKHNALDIRQTGDLYIADVDDATYSNYYRKPMKRLQDYIKYKIVQISQTDYDNLGTKDSSTIYIIVN